MMSLNIQYDWVYMIPDCIIIHYILYAVASCSINTVYAHVQWYIPTCVYMHISLKVRSI